MIKVLVTVILFLTAQITFADPGTAHIIKAKITVKGKEHVGYFTVVGYLYLTKDSLSYAIPKFTQQAKSWVYGDTIAFYSEIFFIKDLDLTVRPVDKCLRVHKNDIAKIAPLELIEFNRWVWTSAPLRSTDKQWILNPVKQKAEMHIERDGLCEYSVLYFNEPDTESVNLVKELELSIRESFESNEDTSARYRPLIEKLRKRRVVILLHCSPT